MAPPHHLHIINPPHCPDEHATFSRFSLLPPELRLRIWTCSLERHRLIEVGLVLPQESTGTRPYSTRNALSRLISGDGYIAMVRALQLNSKLLRVNRESRKAALSFYRVHIPCRLRSSTEPSGKLQMDWEKYTKAVFYYNPEYDFIQLVECGYVGSIFVDFIHDLKAYDPRGIGLLNLALDSNSMNQGLNSLSEISEPSTKVAFITTISQLQEIIWVGHSHLGRQILESPHYYPDLGIHFNHSMPVKAMTPSFDLLERDPRLVGPDLKKVLVGTTDPRNLRANWRKLLKRWDVCRAHPARERVLLAYNIPSYFAQVYDTRSADEFLVEEQGRWLSAQNFRYDLTVQIAGKVPVEGPEELAEAVRPAIGFWLFPAEALGPLEGDLRCMKSVFDLTGYWPELALSILS